jgi:pullulanase/glycogen debranching enzyme
MDRCGGQAPPLAAGVLYELHIGTFSEPGTFEGAIAKLPHLVELGVTHLELMPIWSFLARVAGDTTASTCSHRIMPMGARTN